MHYCEWSLGLSVKKILSSLALSLLYQLLRFAHRVSSTEHCFKINYAEAPVETYFLPVHMYKHLESHPMGIVLAMFNNNTLECNGGHIELAEGISTSSNGLSHYRLCLTLRGSARCDIILCYDNDLMLPARLPACRQALMTHL